MQLRTFLAKDMPAALSQVRRDMGSDAVILSTEVMEDGQVLVRAALDEASVYDDMPFSDVPPDPGANAYGNTETNADEAEVLAQLQAVCAAASDVVRGKPTDRPAQRNTRVKQKLPPARQALSAGQTAPTHQTTSARQTAPVRQAAPVREARSAVELVARQAIAAAEARMPDAKNAGPSGGQASEMEDIRHGGAGLLATSRIASPHSPAFSGSENGTKSRHFTYAGTGQHSGPKFNQAKLLKSLARHRLPVALARALAERAAVSGIADPTAALASAIEERMHVLPIDFTRTQGLLLTGLGGVGKTATVAKLAAHAQLVGRDVCLIAADTQGAGAVARLSAFAEHLRAECIPAESDAVAQRLIRAAQARGVLPIVDTAGCDPRQTVDSLGAAIRGVEIIGVVSAMSDSEEMGEIINAMRYYEISRLIITKTDMARRLGAVVSAALASGMGVAHVTRSPFVADGLEQLSPVSLAQLLVESKEDSVQ